MDAGKTTLSEAMLYTAGELRRLGRVDHADAFLDTDPQERQHAVWYEDARSWQARLALAEEFDLAGISIWTVDKLYRPGLEVLGSTFSVEKIV